MKAALYARVSTSEQKSIAGQLETLRIYCQQRGWEIVAEVEEIESGKKNDRPRRAELLKLAQQRKIDVICVWKLDRWGRSTIDLLATLMELENAGVAFVSFSEAFDLTSPAGRMMAKLLAVFAEYERELICERTKAGVARARAENGGKWGRPAKAQAKAEEVRRLKSRGYSSDIIAAKLQIGETSVRRILKASQIERQKPLA